MPECFITKERGDTYMASVENTKQTLFFTHETLPDFMRERLAMLSVYDARDGIDGIGLRVDAAAYIIFLTPEEAASIALARPSISV